MAQYSGLSGKVYPLHLKPKDDELLSSWIARVALAHGLSIRELGQILQPSIKVSLWLVPDIDLGMKETAAFNALLANLSLRCATPIARILETTLRKFEVRLYNNRLSHKLSRKAFAWILRHEYNPKQPTQRLRVQACPFCLAEDEQPYFRRRWRLAFVVACPRHKSLLIECCPGCGDNIQFHLNASDGVHVKQGTITVCRKCQFDLRNATSQPCAESRVIEFQEHLLSVVKQGYVNIKVIEEISSSTYFTFLYWMLSMVIEKHDLMRGLQSAIFKHYALDLDLSNLPKMYAFESLHVSTRYELMWLLNRLLLDHPDRYLKKTRRSIESKTLCTEMEWVWYSKFLRTPYWYIPVAYAERNRCRILRDEQTDAKQCNSATGDRRRPAWLNEGGEYSKGVYSRIMLFRGLPNERAYQSRASLARTQAVISDRTKAVAHQLFNDGFPVRKIAYICDTTSDAVENWIKERSAHLSRKTHTHSH